MADHVIDTSEESIAEPKRHSLFIDLMLRLVKEKPLGTIGLVLVLILFITGVFADLIAPYPMGKVDLLNTLAPPSIQHPLGTDHLGQDVLSNIIYGARVSLIVGICATLLSTVTAIIIGASSALIGGKFDMIVQRFVDGWMSIPGLVILLTIMSIVGMGLFQVTMAIGIPFGIGRSRLIRSAVFAIKENTYMEAARAIGCTNWRIFSKHLMPNIMPVIIIAFSLSVGMAILMESSLSFLGYGVPPGVPSWGSMLSREGREYMGIAPQLAIWPGLALTVVVYGANMFGDGLRDLLDPRLRGGLGRYGVSKKKVKIRT